MKLGIDVRPLQAETKFRGIGKTLQNVLESVAQIALDDVEFVFYIDPILPEPAELTLFPKSRIISIQSPAIKRKKYIRAVVAPFEAIKPNKQDIDVLLQYDASLGVPTNVPTITIFYDLIPLLFREAESSVKSQRGKVRTIKHGIGKKLNWRKYNAMIDRYGQSAHIISISDASKNDLMSYIPGLSGNKITTVHLGVKSKEAPNQVGDDLKKITASKYLLYVGGIDIRKNILGLLKDFYLLKVKNPELRLLVVGKEFGLQHHLEDLGWNELLASNPSFAKDVISPGFLTDDELRYLYKHASVFVYPSRYEGFGLPILEAMQQGCPVVTYANSSISEISGNAALLVKDGDSVAPAVENILSNASIKEELHKKGIAHVKNFTWSRTAMETIEICRKYSRP